jgi:hypothetical protein
LKKEWKKKFKKPKKKKNIKLYSKTYLFNKQTLFEYHYILISVLESQQEKEKIKIKNDNIDFCLKLFANTYKFMNEMICFNDQKYCLFNFFVF